MMSHSRTLRLEPFLRHGRSYAAASTTVLRLGDERLRQTSREIDIKELKPERSESVNTALVDSHAALAAFRAKHGFGRGLAAPQVGHAVRIVALNIGSQYGAQLSPDGSCGPFSMVNPRIIARSASMFSLWDDCMSLVDEHGAKLDISLKRRTQYEI